MRDKTSYVEAQNQVIEELKTTLSHIDDESLKRLWEEIESAEKIFFVGVGRVLLALQAIAKRLAHLGIQTYFVGQVTEPAITDRDLLIVGSGSGESVFPLAIAKKAKTIGAKVAHIGSNPHSSMGEYTDVFLRIPVRTKLHLSDEIASIQPMTSLFEQSLLILGDILALMMVQEKKIDMKELWKYHANLE